MARGFTAYKIVFKQTFELIFPLNFALPLTITIKSHTMARQSWRARARPWPSPPNLNGQWVLEQEIASIAFDRRRTRCRTGVIFMNGRQYPIFTLRLSMSTSEVSPDKILAGHSHMQCIRTTRISGFTTQRNGLNGFGQTRIRTTTTSPGNANVFPCAACILHGVSVTRNK